MLKLRGLTTMRYQAADLAAATRWYTELLGVEPYLRKPEHVEFRLGDYQHELAIFATKPNATEPVSATGIVAYWHVDDVPAALHRLLDMGAREHEAMRDFGGGYVGASVIDPFGNIVGIMYNPHYLDVLRMNELEEK